MEQDFIIKDCNLNNFCQFKRRYKLHFNYFS